MRLVNKEVVILIFVLILGEGTFISIIAANVGNI